MTIDWRAVLHHATGVPAPRFIEDLAGLVGAEAVDVWLWDHQLRGLHRIEDGAHLSGHDLAETLDADRSVRVRHVGDEMGVVVVRGGDLADPDLQAVADVCAVALRAAGPNIDTLHRRRRRHDMALAAELQWSLLPSTSFGTGDLAVTAAVEPAYDTGGDIFDHAFSEHTLFAAVLDARGHGLRATMTSAVATAAMRRARRSGADLGAIASEIGVAVRSIGGDEEFVSAVLVELDCRTWDGRWLSAGHLPPLKVDPSGARELPLTPTLPLGMVIGDQSSRPTVASFHLDPGASLVLYSDGVVDNTSVDGVEPVGTRRLHEALHTSVAGRPAVASNRARLVVEDLLAFTGGRLRDDATLLIASREHHGHHVSPDPGQPSTC